ncbi:MAG TPA: chemotaxis protein CheW [Candidatus Dormibacteraeota bacterium]
MKVLVLPLGEEHYALPLESVQQIIPRPRVTRMPISDPAILGLLNVRGDIVPLFDAAVLLGTGARGATAFAVLVLTSQGPAALGVEVMPSSSEIDAKPDTPSPTAERLVYPAGDRLVTLLAIEDVLVAGRTGQSRAS